MEEKDTLFARWLNGEVSADELQTMENDGSLESLQRIKAITEHLSIPEYDIKAGFERQQSRRTSSSKVRSINLWTWAGSIAAGITLLVIGWNLNNQQTTMMAQNGQNEDIELTDGTSVVLNDGSSIQYNANGWEKSREIKLHGEAYFRVTKGDKFIVETDQGSVSVLGTQFNVRAWGKALVVECYEGSVAVLVDGQKSTLIADQSVVVENGSMQSISRINHDGPTWMNGTSVFNNSSLMEVLLELERQYDIKVESSKLNRSFSGSFEHDDLEQALVNICKPLGLNFKISANRKVILIE